MCDSPGKPVEWSAWETSIVQALKTCIFPGGWLPWGLRPPASPPAALPLPPGLTKCACYCEPLC